jgi:hypothetical protein
VVAVAAVAAPYRAVCFGNLNEKSGRDEGFAPALMAAADIAAKVDAAGGRSLRIATVCPGCVA